MLGITELWRTVTRSSQSPPLPPDPSRALQVRNVRYLTLDTATQGVIGAGIGSFLSIFLVRMGASNLSVGLLTALPALVTIFLSMPAGAFVAGRPDAVRLTNIWRLPIRSSYVLIALVPLLATGEIGAILVVVIWALTALPGAVVNSTWTNVVADTVPPDVRPRVNGNRWALLSIVTAIAVAGFGRLLDALVFPLNYQVVFVASFVAGLVSIYFFAQIRIPRQVQAERPFSMSGSVSGRPNVLGVLLGLGKQIREERDFGRFVVSSLVYRLGLNLPVAVFPIFWVQTLAASDTTIGLRTTAGNAALVVAYFVWGRVAARWGHRRVLLLSSLGLGFYPILTALVKTPEPLVAVAVVWGAFAAGIDIAFFEALLRTCPPDRRTAFVAANTAFANLAIFVAPLAGTLLLGVLDIRLVLVLSGGFSFVGAALFYVLAVAKH